ncbi:MAG: DNA translocase FtsK [Clostridiales bacterium]|nr:DNA translocase FtsK [Clostridiales bacterium]
MASKQNKKKSSKTQNKRKNAAKQAEIRESGMVQDEIILIITLVISVLLFLSNFDLSGKVGDFFSSIIFGLIGVEAYIFPFALFFLTAFHISNLGNRKAGRKILSAIVFLVALTALIQLISTPYDPNMKFFEYYTTASNERRGGGIIGGIFVMIFCSLFDTVATYIIIIAIMLISLIVITGKALILRFAKSSNRALQERKQYQKLRKEQQLAYEKEHPQEVPVRRPMKTFLFDTGKKAKKEEGKSAESTDTNTVIDLKDRKMKKEQTQKRDELPINLDHLFNDKTEEGQASEQTSSIDPVIVGPVPTYEDELRSKFGKSENSETDSESSITDDAFVTDTNDRDTTVESQATNSSTDTTVVEQNQKDHGRTEKHKPSNKTSNTTDVEQLNIDQTREKKVYIYPPTKLLSVPKLKVNKGSMERNLKDTALKLQSTLDSFGVHVTITNVSCGPAVTRYELQPEQGVKVSKITALADDIKLNLAASDIRIEAPIPGKAVVGIEVPNKENSMVTLREMLESKEFQQHPSDIAFAVGKDIGGQTIVTDIAKMPHLLIAGATGSGKSVCINTLIMSILFKSDPSDVRLIMIDPKVVELSVYNGIPHLLIPVVTDPKKASAALNWAVMEMTERYKKFADVGVRDLKGYNEKVAQVENLNDSEYQRLPQIVIIIDELADLMMVAPGEVEDAICRLAQLARAAGLHLVIATQRPSVNVITGLIKANIPSRIAFAVSSAVDSRTILDGSGAEKLLGKGDMLFFPSGYPKPVRVQGAFISDKEVNAVVEFIKKNNSETEYSEEIKDKITNATLADSKSGSTGVERDEYFIEAGKFIIEKDKASIGMLQRVYRIGFNRAARIMDQLAEAGVVGPEEGTKPRKVLMSLEQFEEYLELNG